MQAITITYDNNKCHTSKRLHDEEEEKAKEKGSETEKAKEKGNRDREHVAETEI